MCDEIGVDTYECVMCGIIVRSPGTDDERSTIIVEHGDIYHIFNLAMWQLFRQNRWEDAQKMKDAVLDSIADTGRALRTMMDYVSIASRNDCIAEVCE